MSAPKPQIHIRAVEGRSLAKVQTFGKQDPYCVVKLGKQRFRSTTDDNGGTKPRWNEKFVLFVTNPHSDVIEIEVWDENALADEFIGGTKVPVTTLLNGNLVEDWLPLFKHGKSAGELNVRMQYLTGAPTTHQPGAPQYGAPAHAGAPQYGAPTHGAPGAYPVPAAGHQTHQVHAGYPAASAYPAGAPAYGAPAVSTPAYGTQAPAGYPAQATATYQGGAHGGAPAYPGAPGYPGAAPAYPGAPAQAYPSAAGVPYPPAHGHPQQYPPPAQYGHGGPAAYGGHYPPQTGVAYATSSPAYGVTTKDKKHKKDKKDKKNKHKNKHGEGLGAVAGAAAGVLGGLALGEMLFD